MDSDSLIYQSRYEKISEELQASLKSIWQKTHDAGELIARQYQWHEEYENPDPVLTEHIQAQMDCNKDLMTAMQTLLETIEDFRRLSELQAASTEKIHQIADTQLQQMKVMQAEIAYLKGIAEKHILTGGK